MAIAAQPTPPPITYEQYLAEEPTNERYDIVDGVRYYMNPNRLHQNILLNIAELFRKFERATRRGKTIIAACDVLISRHPLRTRQPDLLFISHEQLQQCRDSTDPAPLAAAPEVVVEILSPSDTRRVLDAKVVDYQSVGVKECWIVSPQAETVEVLRLTEQGADMVEIYANTQTITSALWPDLSFPVAEIFVE
jgi:Uma2 family endonuclease